MDAYGPIRVQRTGGDRSLMAGINIPGVKFNLPSHC